MRWSDEEGRENYIDRSKRNKSGGKERFSEVIEKWRDGSKEQKKKMGETEQETEREREKGERRLSPSRRTKDEANNGEAFSEAEVAGRSIFSLASMQQREREGEREGNREKGVKKGREERRDEC